MRPRQKVEIELSGCDAESTRWIRGADVERMTAHVGPHESPKAAAIRSVGQRLFDPRRPRTRYGLAPDPSVRGDGWCRVQVVRNGHHIEATVMLRWRVETDESEAAS